jgi:ankyrin repeat protein
MSEYLNNIIEHEKYDKIQDIDITHLSPDTNNVNETLLTYACFKQYYYVVKELIKRGANVNTMCEVDFPIHAAINYKDSVGGEQDTTYKIVSLLIKRGCNINVYSNYLNIENGTALYFAIRKKFRHASLLLLLSGAVIDIKSKYALIENVRVYTFLHNKLVKKYRYEGFMRILPLDIVKLVMDSVLLD